MMFDTAGDMTAVLAAWSVDLDHRTLYHGAAVGRLLQREPVTLAEVRADLEKRRALAHASEQIEAERVQLAALQGAVLAPVLEHALRRMNRAVAMGTTVGAPS